MRIIVLAVGKVKERGVREAIDDYLGRVKRYVAVEEIELKDGAPAQVADALRKRLPEGAHVVALEVLGKSLTSEGFARSVERAGSRGKGIVVFLIGGADGLPSDVSSAAHERVSLSSMTLPHRLARLFLAEQLYRAMTILRGEPYNK